MELLKDIDIFYALARHVTTAGALPHNYARPHSKLQLFTRGIIQ
jgi:hypothetical protein